MEKFTEKKDKIYALLNIREIDSFDIDNIDYLNSELFINKDILFSIYGEIILEYSDDFKKIINPNILKIKKEKEINGILLVPSDNFIFLKNKVIEKKSKNIDIQFIENNDIEDIEEDIQDFDSSSADKLLFDILYSAKIREVSDIHILPKKNNAVIKFRENGSLIIYKIIKKQYIKYLVNRIKERSNLNITNKLTPQDGKFKLEIEDENIEIRVSTANTIYGENAVLRVQRTTSLFDISLDDIGFEKDDLEKYRRNFKNPYGMILNVGATGQGKTTTFYLTINELFELFPDKNISTAEDPVEIEFENAVQFEINEASGLTFARVLKALLRQDPDIVLIGEVRDEETAEIVTKAAMTGHLVLSTLHATDSSNAFPRLRDIGISSQQIASTVSCVLSQRLVRKLCSCKEKIAVPKDFKEKYNFEENFIYRESGCDLCNNTGFKGRTAIIEVLELNEEIKTALADGVGEIALKKIIKKYNFQNLWKNGLKKLKRGEISLSELERVVKPDTIYDLTREGEE